MVNTDNAVVVMRSLPLHEHAGSKVQWRYWNSQKMLTESANAAGPQD